MKKISTDDILAAVGAPTPAQMATIRHLQLELDGWPADGSPRRLYASYPQASGPIAAGGTLFGMPVVRGPVGILVTDGTE